MTAPIAKSDAERRKIIQDIEDLKQAKGYVSIDMACQDIGISRDVYYSYKKSIRDTPPEITVVPSEPLTRTEELPELTMTVKESPARISVPISKENYIKVSKVAARKAMTISAVCANILDDGIKRLE